MANKQVTDKRKVRMTTFTPFHEAVDYVPAAILDAYVADAKTRWAQVVVGDEPDAGPGGIDGETIIPAHLSKE
jgi:hypothetical protein